MNTCNICLEDLPIVYRPYKKNCDCKFNVHESCFNAWLTKSNNVYKCIICYSTYTPKNYSGPVRLILILLSMFLLSKGKDVFIPALINYMYVIFVPDNLYMIIIHNIINL